MLIIVKKNIFMHRAKWTQCLGSYTDNDAVNLNSFDPEPWYFHFCLIVRVDIREPTI